MKDFRGPLPLTDADFAAIRANVLAKVQPRRTSLVWRFAFAAVIAAFVGLLSWDTDPAQAPTVERRPGLPAGSQRNGRQDAGAPGRAAFQAAVPPASSRQVAAPQNDIVRRKPRAPEPAAPQFRMEIQTSDPDIRIIWLPNEAYKPKSNTLEDQS